MQHPSGIPEKIVNKVFARRGRLHAFDTIEPATTALVVIDLDEATVAPDGTWPGIIANVNRLAAAVRSRTKIRRLFTYTRARAIAVRGTLAQVGAAEQLIRE